MPKVRGIMLKLVLALACALPTAARAQESSREAVEARAHGPAAGSRQFPSHVFQRTAHEPPGVQLAFHFGLVQPVLLKGMNAAVDVRYKRLILTYSHGAGLDVTRFLSAEEKAAGMTVREPWTTGGGIGLTLVDELWLLVDFKVHRFEVDLDAQHQAYTTMTLGAELGYRYFLWRGLNIALVARYWPNIYASTKGVVLHDSQGERLVHKPMEQGSSGFFANVLLGWAFNL
jgi:hypothetical protein